MYNVRDIGLKWLIYIMHKSDKERRTKIIHLLLHHDMLLWLYPNILYINKTRKGKKKKKILKQRRKREYAKDENGERANEVYLLNINEGK